MAGVMTSDTPTDAKDLMMSRRPAADPDQLPLWWCCDVCGCPHYGLKPDMYGRRREHRHCGKAIDRWFRTDNHDDWINEPNRAVL
jgi:hypothetical protein